MTDPVYRQMMDFLVELGIAEMSHTSKTYLGHLLAVYRLLQDQGCNIDTCRAGIFHSIYGGIPEISASAGTSGGSPDIDR
jgi:hypothetical protein